MHILKNVVDFCHRINIAKPKISILSATEEVLDSMQSSIDAKEICKLAEKENLIEYFAQTGLVVLSLNLLMMIIAFYWAKFFGTGTSQQKAISIECGLQNGTLAIFVGTSVFGGGLYIIPAATYSVIMYLTSLIFIYFIRNR